MDITFDPKTSDRSSWPRVNFASDEYSEYDYAGELHDGTIVEQIGIEPRVSRVRVDTKFVDGKLTIYVEDGAVWPLEMIRDTNTEINALEILKKLREAWTKCDQAIQMQKTP